MAIEQTYYWIVTTLTDPKSGAKRMVVIGPKSNESEANTYAYEKLDANCSFDIVGLPTKDRGRATSILKAKRLTQTSNLSQSLQPTMHEGGLAQSKKHSRNPNSTQSGAYGHSGPQEGNVY